jgi:hypothetical protein
MCELVCLVVAFLEGNEDAKIVLARGDSDGRASEFGTYLVIAPRMDALFGTADVESANGRMVGGLLGEVGYPDGAARGVGRCLDDRDR